jgi:hypothetical protein
MSNGDSEYKMPGFVWAAVIVVFWLTVWFVVKWVRG